MIGIGTDFANLSGERSYSLSYYTKGALLYSHIESIFFVAICLSPFSKYLLRDKNKMESVA